MAEPIDSVAATASGAIALGKMCVHMMRALRAPTQRAAVTNSCSLSCKNIERTMRATVIQLSRPMASTMVETDGPKNTDRAMMRKMPGMLSMMSVNRMMILSTTPPK